MGHQESWNRKIDRASPVQRITQTSMTVLFCAEVIALTCGDVSVHLGKEFEVCTDECVQEKVGRCEDSDHRSSLIYFTRKGAALRKCSVRMKA